MVVAAITTIALLAQPIAYHSSEGWKARIQPVEQRHLDMMALWLEKVQNNPNANCYGGGRPAELMVKDPPGTWAACDVRLDGHTVEVWKDTHAVFNLTGDRTLYSSQIIASPDPCERQVLDNTVTPFVVTERIHGYHGTARLYIRFNEPVPFDEIESWELRER